MVKTWDTQKGRVLHIWGFARLAWDTLALFLLGFIAKLHSPTGCHPCDFSHVNKRFRSKVSHAGIACGTPFGESHSRSPVNNQDPIKNAIACYCCAIRSIAGFSRIWIKNYPPETASPHTKENAMNRCEDCPPKHYPTNKTRCLECPLRPDTPTTQDTLE